MMSSSSSVDKGKDTNISIFNNSLISGQTYVRWIVAFLAFVGFIFNYMLRVNINLTIVSMVNFTIEENDTENECNRMDLDTDQGNNKDEEGEFVWDSVVQSQIVGSFYYGYILTQVPGGRMSEVIGSKRVLGASMAGVAILK